jgi:hypothetical protein
VLVAEDEPSIAEIVTHVLRGIGCETTHAADGQSAWDLLAARPGFYSVILLDLNMPGITGLELFRRARALPYSGAVIVTSGRISEDERQELLDLRAAAILQKPFTVEKLLAALGQAGVHRSS